MQSFFRKLILWAAVFGVVISAAAEASLQPQVVSFTSRKQKLKGYLWVPEGDGPFPAMVWSYGHHERLMNQGPPSQFDRLARFYLEMKYVLFVPDRGATPGQKDDGSPEAFERINDAKTKDLISAISWIRQQSYVNAAKVAVSGSLNGSLHALLAAERDSTIHAVVISTPGSITWNNNPALRTLMHRGVKNANVPIFLFQPQNDKSLGPTQALGPLLAEKGKRNRTKVYLPYEGEIRSFGKDAVNVWGPDVRAFLEGN